MPFPAPAPTVNTAPTFTRITLSERPKLADGAVQTAVSSPAASEARTVSTFLPVSFTRGTLLGGLDAPTGGQAQSNPHPILIRLSDNSVLPNRFRGEYRECFVIAAGYGDISSERAYLRTENLSCVRADGATLEVKIQGSVYGEDGKVGLRGRLVTKQGQMLANALLAGVVSGIGQGVSTASTTYSTSALGTIASASGSDAYRAGIGSGVGKALDRLAQYYIKLAENTFPVIEVDAGREIDVVITKGVRIDVPMTASLLRNQGFASRVVSVRVSEQDARVTKHRTEAPEARHQDPDPSPIRSDILGARERLQGQAASAAGSFDSKAQIVETPDGTLKSKRSLFSRTGRQVAGDADVTLDAAKDAVQGALKRDK